MVQGCIQGVKQVFPFVTSEMYPFTLTILHSEWPKLPSFGCSECNRVKLQTLPQDKPEYCDTELCAVECHSDVAV